MISSHIVPFLADHPSYGQGLNLLGYKSICETLFTKLLPGLNGVTSRIRYYSFYCWLIDEFNSFGVPISETSYREYIRKSEYLLALIHVPMNNGTVETGIPGIDYAAKAYMSADDEISLIDGIYNEKGGTEHTYWKNKGGILTQYYLASLSDDLGLLEAVDSKNRLRNISKEGDFINGLNLAEAFRKSIGEDAAKHFLQIVKKGRVLKSELNELAESFYMKGFTNAAGEQELLLELLLQTDVPRSDDELDLRKQTISHFLEFATDATLTTDDSQNFAFHMYERYVDEGQKDLCTIGWYLYCLNENWQYCLTEIFVEVLDSLKEDYNCCWVPIHKLARSFAEGMISVWDFKGETLGEFYQAIKDGEIDSTDADDRFSICADAFFDIAYRVYENEDKKLKDDEYAKVFRIAGNPGTFYKFMEEFLSSLDMNLEDFICKAIEDKIIYKHYAESMRKWSYGGGVATHKFMLENGCVRYLDSSYSSHTAPRLRTLKGFLVDLGLIGWSGGLTDFGKGTLELIRA